jgi:tetratricopeptide (TPR) repeat protein
LPRALIVPDDRAFAVHPNMLHGVPMYHRLTDRASRPDPRRSAALALTLALIAPTTAAAPEDVAVDPAGGLPPAELVEDRSPTGDDAGAPSPDSLDLFRSDLDGAGDPVAEAIDRRINLGRIQRSNGEYAVAVDTLEDALDRVRDEYGVWDPRMVSVLAELAAARQGLGDFEVALGLFEQAVHVNRVNEGLHDVSQLEMLDAMTELKAELGDWEAADEIQEYAFYVQQREYGATPALLPGLYRYANWQRRTGAILSARVLYESAVEIIETHYGPEDIRLVDALHGIATTYRLERYPVTTRARQQDEDRFSISTSRGGMADPTLEDSRIVLNRYGDGEDALARIVHILETHEDTPPRQLAQALLDLADWYLIFDKWNDAFETYARTREVLTTAGWDEARMGTLFGEPTPLVFPLPAPPDPPGAGSDLVEVEGWVDLTYDVTDRGRVRSVDVVAARPEGLMDFRTRKAIKAARFRPRFVDGEPVDTEDVQYRHSFVYYRPEEPPMPEGTASASPAPASETD